MNELRNLRKVAVIDGIGKNAEVHLHWANDDYDCIEEIPWPYGDRYVSRRELEADGYEVVVA